MTQFGSHLLATLMTFAPVGADAEGRVSIAPVAEWEDARHETSDGNVIYAPVVIVNGGSSPPSVREEFYDRYLPSSCLRSFEGASSTIRYFESGCLRDSHIETYELPRACRVTVQAFGSIARGYSAPCMRDNGYRLADR